MHRRDLYHALRARIEALPVINTHEHTAGPAYYPKYGEAIQAIIQGYIQSDFVSAGGEAEFALLNDPEVSTERKWPTFARLWKRLEHTGYAHVSKWVLREIYGVREVTLEALQGMNGRLLDLSDPEKYGALLKQYGMQCRIVSLPRGTNSLFFALLQGKHALQPYDRPVIVLPMYHSGVRSADAVNTHAARSGRIVTSLDDYLAVCREQFERAKALGAVAMKDQSAYERTLAYENPSRAEAERLFNFMMADPRHALGWPEAKPLDDFLFHQFLRMAREMDLPVQLHTGAMAGNYNEIGKTNAVLLTPVLEMYRDIRFSLFHGNWPYAGEWLFLGKGYPNVVLDCCWLHIIDPRYAQRVLADTLTVLPHGKIHGYGGDHYDCIEYSVAHLSIARDNIAAALAEMVDAGWLDEEAALQVAADWLFNNPNEFYRLGFAPMDASVLTVS